MGTYTILYSSLKELLLYLKRDVIFIKTKIIEGVGYILNHHILR